MNSGRKVEQDQPFGNWLEKARRKYVGACVHGCGQFCVRVMDGKNVYLYETCEAATEHKSRDPKFRLEDLSTEPVKPVHKTNGFANIKSMSDAEDRDWERRFEREKKERG